MPELPDIAIYIEALEERFTGQTIEAVRVASPFLVRSYDPPLSAVKGQVVRGFRRLGKRIVWELDDELFLVLHLMVAGRLKLRPRGATVPKRLGLCAWDFPHQTLLLTEASKKKRASLHVVRGERGLADLDPGGIDVMTCTLEAFSAALTEENHTLKRTLTDPHVFSGIGNAYSDEILHRAKLSPVKWTSRLSANEIATLHTATRAVLTEWVERLRAERSGAFPENVTAFRPEMAVHGKFKAPCPVCGTPVQRIVRGESEVNYCPTCQTDGKLLADRALSRLLHGDWPKTLEELDERKANARRAAPVPEPTTSASAGLDEPRARTRARPRSRPDSHPTRASAAAKPKPRRAPKATGTRPPRPLLLFAHGAGAGSSSSWMVRWAERLGALGEVVRFDYAFMREGRRRPDRFERLLAEHAAALAAHRAGWDGPVVLIGKSMGGRLGCHVSLERPVDALVCLGYPLLSPGKAKTGARARRDEVLLALRAPVMFVQGTRDPLCPLDELDAVRTSMTAPHALHVVETGDHSLCCTKTWLKRQETTQDAVDAITAKAIAAFLAEHL